MFELYDRVVVKGCKGFIDGVGKFFYTVRINKAGTWVTLRIPKKFSKYFIKEATND